MKPKKALKEINKIFNEDITNVVLLGKSKDDRFVEMLVSDTETIIDLLMNLLEDQPDLRDALLKTMLGYHLLKSEAEDNDEQH